MENEGKGEGVGRAGGGVVAGKGTGKSMRMRLSKLPFSDLPFSSRFQKRALWFSRRKYPPATQQGRCAATNQ